MDALNALPASPRQYASSCVYEEKIFIAGGVLGTGVTTSEIWSYNTQNNTWFFETSFPGGGGQAPVLLSLYDKMYMGLGRNDTVYYNDWWMYDLHEKNWISLAQVPFNARFDAEGIEMAGMGFVGLGKNSLQCFSDWWVFDPLTNEWQQKQSFPAARRYHPSPPPARWLAGPRRRRNHAARDRRAGFVDARGWLPRL